MAPLNTQRMRRSPPMLRCWLALGAAGLFASLHGVTPAIPVARAAPKGASLESLALSVQRVTLDNGLRVVLNVDPAAPNVAVCVAYDVGSRNEEAGRTGFAHLFEHMMFQGSAHVAKGEHF